MTGSTSPLGPEPATALVSADEVRYVARLARLGLSDEEVERLSVQLSAILDHVEAVCRLEVAGVEPTTHPRASANVLRTDEPLPSLDRSVVLSQAPAAEADCFKVPPVLGGTP